MIARSCTRGTDVTAAGSVVEVVINLIDLSRELLHVVEDELRLLQQFALEAAAENGDDRERNAMCGEDVVRRVADDERQRRIGADAVQRGAEYLRGWLR